VAADETGDARPAEGDVGDGTCWERYAPRSPPRERCVFEERCRAAYASLSVSAVALFLAASRMTSAIALRPDQLMVIR